MLRCRHPQEAAAGPGATFITAMALGASLIGLQFLPREGIFCRRPMSHEGASGVERRQRHGRQSSAAPPQKLQGPVEHFVTARHNPSDRGRNMKVWLHSDALHWLPSGKVTLVPVRPIPGPPGTEKFAIPPRVRRQSVFQSTPSQRLFSDQRGCL